MIEMLLGLAQPDSVQQAGGLQGATRCLGEALFADAADDDVDDSELPPFPTEQYPYGSLWEAILAHL